MWPFELRTLRFHGQRVAYTDEGSGPAVVFVEEGMWSFIWGPVMSILATQFRVVALDFPGSGLSPATDKEQTLRGDAHLLESFVEALELPKSTFVLHDLAGPVGIDFAQRRPERVRGLVLVRPLPGLRATPCCA